MCGWLGQLGFWHELWATKSTQEKTVEAGKVMRGRFPLVKSAAGQPPQLADANGRRNQMATANVKTGTICTAVSARKSRSAVGESRGNVIIEDGRWLALEP